MVLCGNYVFFRAQLTVGNIVRLVIGHVYGRIVDDLAFVGRQSLVVQCLVLGNGKEPRGEFLALVEGAEFLESSFETLYADVLHLDGVADNLSDNRADSHLVFGVQC